MSKEINEDTAKRSIIKLESLVKGLVKDATAFVKKNKTNGLTTPALKRKANSLIEDLEDQFKRMAGMDYLVSNLVLRIILKKHFFFLKLNFRSHKRLLKKL